MIEVYYALPSIYGRKVLAMLDEKELDYKINWMSFAESEHTKDDYLKINPNGEIPALVDEGFVVYESTAINEYLEDEYPEPRLMPQDSESRARVRMVEEFCDLHLHPALVRILVSKVVRKEEPSEELIQDALKALGRIETYLGDQTYLAGEFSLADIAFMPAVPSAEAFGLAEKAFASRTMKAYVARLKTHRGYQGASLLEQPVSTAG